MTQHNTHVHLARLRLPCLFVFCLFTAVRGALVASVPGRHDVEDEPEVTRWGWAGLRHALRAVPCRAGGGGGDTPEIVVQISSIATLGPTDAWLRPTLFGALSASKNNDQDGGGGSDGEEGVGPLRAVQRPTRKTMDAA